MADDLPEQLKELDNTLAGIESVLDLPGLHAQLDDLESQASDPELWSDQTRAQGVTSKLSRVRADINRVEGLRSRLEDAQAGVDLGDPDLITEVEHDLPKLRRQISGLEGRTLLSGEYDEREAIGQHPVRADVVHQPGLNESQLGM